MTLAVLYTFHQWGRVERNHLQLLRHHNREVPVYGLFVGSAGLPAQDAASIRRWCDDLFALPAGFPAYFVRHLIHAVIVIWYQQRGRQLSWDSVVHVHWDHLILGPLSRHFGGLRAEQLYYPGLRELTRGRQARWPYLDSMRARLEMEYFIKRLAMEEGYRGPLFCAPWALVVLARRFLEQMRSVPSAFDGFLEYSWPTLGSVLGYSFFGTDIGVCWDTEPGWESELHARPVNTMRVSAEPEFVAQELEKGEGWRIFHPYYGAWPLPEGLEDDPTAEPCPTAVATDCKLPESVATRQATLLQPWEGLSLSEDRVAGILHSFIAAATSQVGVIEGRCISYWNGRRYTQKWWVRFWHDVRVVMSSHPRILLLLPLGAWRRYQARKKRSRSRWSGSAASRP